MIVSKNNESVRVVSGFYQGYGLAGIWNKGVYVPFTNEEEVLFSTVKGYVVLTDGVSPGNNTPAFNGATVSTEQLMAGLENCILDYDIVEMKKPFEAEVVFNESEVPYTDNEENEFPFGFFAIEKTALPDGATIVTKTINPINNEIVESSAYEIGELSVVYNEGEPEEKTIEYYVIIGKANVSGQGIILYPTAE